MPVQGLEEFSWIFIYNKKNNEKNHMFLNVLCMLNISLSFLEAFTRYYLQIFCFENENNFSLKYKIKINLRMNSII